MAASGQLSGRLRAVSRGRRHLRAGGVLCHRCWGIACAP